MNVNLNSDNGHLLIMLFLFGIGAWGHARGDALGTQLALTMVGTILLKLNPKTNSTLTGGPPEAITVPTPSGTAGTGDVVHVETKEVPPAPPTAPPHQGAALPAVDAIPAIHSPATPA